MTIEITKFRKPEVETDTIFINRWSPRAMSGETVDRDLLMTLFEAAKWAPSSFNEQPWRFIYVTRDHANWNGFLSLLMEQNQLWARNAGALVLLVSKAVYSKNGNSNRSHAFEAGAAWENFALQGALKGLVVHAMGGFDREKAREYLSIPDDFKLMVMGAVGHPGDPADLPESFQEREFPSSRKKLEEITSEGQFPPSVY